MLDFHKFESIFHLFPLCPIISRSVVGRTGVVIESGNGRKLRFHLSEVIFSWPHSAADLLLLISGRVEKKRQQQKAASGKIVTSWHQLYFLF